MLIKKIKEVKSGEAELLLTGNVKLHRNLLASRISTTGGDPLQLPHPRMALYNCLILGPEILYSVMESKETPTCQEDRKIRSCSQFQHESTSIFLAWTVQSVMCSNQSGTAEKAHCFAAIFSHIRICGILLLVLHGRESSHVGTVLPLFLKLFEGMSYLHWTSHFRHKL